MVSHSDQRLGEQRERQPHDNHRPSTTVTTVMVGLTEPHQKGRKVRPAEAAVPAVRHAVDCPFLTQCHSAIIAFI